MHSKSNCLAIADLINERLSLTASKLCSGDNVKISNRDSRLSFDHGLLRMFIGGISIEIDTDRHLNGNCFALP